MLSVYLYIVGFGFIYSTVWTRKLCFGMNNNEKEDEVIALVIVQFFCNINLVWKIL